MLIDEAKRKACKNDSELLILCLETLETEFNKKIELRDAEGIAATKKMVDDALAGHEQRMAERFPQFAAPAGLDAGSKKNQFSVHRAALAYRHNDPTLGPLEYDFFNGKEHREFIQKVAGLTNGDALGALMIPNALAGGIIEKLQPATIAFKLGVRQFEVGQVASLTFNRLTGNATAEWVGEMLTAAKSDLTYGQYTVSPKALSAKSDISNLLLMLGSNEAEARFNENAALMFAQAIDRGVLIGPATPGPKAPVGIAGTANIQNSSSASLTFDKLVDFEDKLRTANAYFGTLGWAMTEAQYTVVRKLKDTSNQPIVLRSLTEKGVREIFGYPVYTTTQMGTTGANTLAFGAWNQATLFSWFGGILMKRSDVSDTALDNDLTRVTLRRYCDVGVDQPTAFVFASD